MTPILTILLFACGQQWERVAAWQYRDARGDVTTYAIEADWLSPVVEPSTAHTATLLGWRLLARRKPFFGILAAYVELERTEMMVAFPMGPPEPEREISDGR